MGCPSPPTSITLSAGIVVFGLDFLDGCSMQMKATRVLELYSIYTRKNRSIDQAHVSCTSISACNSCILHLVVQAVL